MATSPVDRLREQLGAAGIPAAATSSGWGPANQGPAGGHQARLADGAARGRTRPQRLDDDERGALTALAVLGLIGALIVHPIHSAVSQGDSWWQHWGAALLGWPAPLVQPIVLGLAAGALIVAAIATKGFTSVSPMVHRILLVASITVAVALVPLILMLLALLVYLAIMIALGVFLIVALIAALAGLATSN